MSRRGDRQKGELEDGVVLETCSLVLAVEVRARVVRWHLWKKSELGSSWEGQKGKHSPRRRRRKDSGGSWADRIRTWRRAAMVAMEGTP